MKSESWYNDKVKTLFLVGTQCHLLPHCLCY
uniref:Uncharacterized protein n=1 Tax=Rhizophora mucronata TaxID=61149 RepID=A0A2P2PA16_RHIMU